MPLQRSLHLNGNENNYSTIFGIGSRQERRHGLKFGTDSPPGRITLLGRCLFVILVRTLSILLSAHVKLSLKSAVPSANLKNPTIVIKSLITATTPLTRRASCTGCGMQRPETRQYIYPDESLTQAHVPLYHSMRIDPAWRNHDLLLHCNKSIQGRSKGGLSTGGHSSVF